MELLRRLLILQWHPRKRKMLCHVYNPNEKYCLSLKAEDGALLNIRSKNLPLYWSHWGPCWTLSLTEFLSNNLSMKWSTLIFLMITIFLKLDIVVTLPSLTHIFSLSNPLKQYFHIFRKKTIHSFMIPSTTKIHNWFYYILFTDLRKMHPERI